jgi:hypothetical protein
LVQERLAEGIASSEGVEAYEVFFQVDFGANEAMAPVGIDQEAATEQVGVAGFAGAAQEDEESLGLGLEVGLPGRREGASLGSGFDPQSGLEAIGGDVLVRASL